MRIFNPLNSHADEFRFWEIFFSTAAKTAICGQDKIHFDEASWWFLPVVEVQFSG
jgi:hypothetical protein